MKPLRDSFALVGRQKLVFVGINLFYFGLVGLAMILVTANRQVQATLMDLINQSFSQGPLAEVLEAYTGGQALRAIALTFLINLFLGSLVYITLPSLVVPFAGLLVGGIRAFFWGLIFSPSSEAFHSQNAVLTAFLILGLLFLEGEGYVLAMFAAYLHGKAFLFPKSAGTEGYGQGYRVGLVQTARIYLLVILVLAVAALYEVMLVTVWLPAIR